MKYISCIILYFCSVAAFSAPYSKQRNRLPRPKGSYCRDVLGDKAYQEYLDSPGNKTDSLPHGYWNDYRLLKVLDALVEHKLPLSATYLTAVASAEGLDDIVAAALGNQPAATLKKFLSAVTYRFTSLGKFCKAAGVYVNDVTLPEQIQVNLEGLFDAIQILVEAKISVNAKHILQFYPEENIAQKWRDIFGIDVTGPMLWLLAREYGYRWDEAVNVVRREVRQRNIPGHVIRSAINQKTANKLSAPMTYENVVALFPSDLPRTDRLQYDTLAKYVIESTEVITTTDLARHLMASFLIDERIAEIQVQGFLKILKQEPGP